MRQQTFLDQKPTKLMGQDAFHEFAVAGLGKALEDGLDVASSVAQQLVSMEEGSGLALGEFLHGVNFRWEIFDKEKDDTFQKWAVRSTGRAPATVQRRVCVWEFLSNEYIPADYRPGIEGFSVKMLSKAYKVALRHKNNKYTGKLDFEPSGFDLEASDWLSLSECVDEAMLTEVMDKIMGREPNSNRMSFKLDDNGDIWFYKGKKDSSVIGTLSVRNQSPLVKDGIAELMERAGITERNEY